MWEGMEEVMKMIRNLIIVLMSILLTTGCQKNMSNEEIAKIIGTDELKTEYYMSSFVIDTDDLSSVTTYAKYIFVGTIDDYVKTEYNSEDENEVYTYYSVKVLENIKGELVQNKNVEVKKAGGITKDEKSFLMCKDDILPAVGNTYIFAAVMFEKDGSIYCYGPNTVRLIENVDNYKEDKTYNAYIEALNTIVVDIPKREWSISKFDVNYKKE